MRSRLASYAAALSLLLAALPAAFPQTFTGTITGTVTDPNGAAIPSAAVRARNEATNDVRQATSNTEGLYIFSQLPPGNYEVSAEAPGFRKSVQTSAVLRVAQTPSTWSTNGVLGSMTCGLLRRMGPSV